MCTATWLMADDGYELFCNRDENRTRKPALPPVVQERSGVRFIAPRDGDFGGSWIGVNDRGVSLCLLNHYAPQTRMPGPDRTSRGLLLVSLMDCATQQQVTSRLRSATLTAYAPFILLALAPGRPVVSHTWDGAALSSKPKTASPVTTSSFDTDTVIQRRKNMFAQMTRERVDPNTLAAYHASRDPRGGAYSVCMSRDDAESVSFSHIKATPELIEFSYRQRSTQSGRFGDPTSVALAMRSG